mgnify:CR=1 FL=1
MKIELTEDKLVIKFSLKEKLEAVKGGLEIPISSIVDIKPFKDAGVDTSPAWFVHMGTYLGKTGLGSFPTSKGWTFMATKDIDNSTVLFLKDFNYNLAIIDLDEKTLEELKERIKNLK